MAAMAIRPVLDMDPGDFPFLTFLPAVALTAFFAGTRAAIICALLSGLTARYYLIQPLNSFVLDVETGPALGVFLFVCCVIIYLLHLLSRTANKLEAQQAVAVGLIAQQRTMFAEFQHRVANNLTFLSSLLALQKRQVAADPALAPQVFENIIQRMEIMGRIHRRLHDPAALDQRLPDYLRELCADLLDATGARGVDCLVDADDVRLDLARLTALSLLLTELVSNSLKHAFGPDGGTIRIRLKRLQSGLVELEVADDGRGFPEGFNLNQSAGLGLRIINGLVAQLGGEISLPKPGGALTKLIFVA